MTSWVSQHVLLTTALSNTKTRAKMGMHRWAGTVSLGIYVPAQGTVVTMFLYSPGCWRLHSQDN